MKAFFDIYGLNGLQLTVQVLLSVGVFGKLQLHIIPVDH